MRKKTRKIISIFLLVMLIATDNSFISAADRVLAMSAETAYITELSNATYSEATPSIESSYKAAPSEAAPSEAAPSEATPSEATPSEATPSEAKESFIQIRPEEKPSWYKKTGKLYQFEDRDGIIQYRIYGKIGEEGEEGWYQSDETGVLLEDATFAQPVDLDWEDNYDAPYRFDSALASRSTFMELSETLFCDEKEIFQYSSEVTTKRPFGRNYDGSYYNVWHFFNNIENEQVLEEQKDWDTYFMYGHVINTYSSDLSQNRWFEVSNNGKVIVDEFQNVATPSMAVPLEIPKYYNKTNNDEIWNFTDRDDQVQYRTFLNNKWFECDSDGILSQQDGIDLNWEYYNLAPYIYESSEPKSNDIDNVVKMDFGANYDWFTYKTVYTNEGNGVNWDGSCYNLTKVKIGIIDRDLKDKGTDRYYFFGKIKNKIDSDKEDSSDDYSDFWQSGDLKLSLFDLNSMEDIINQELEKTTEENDQKDDEWYRSGEDFIVRSKVTTSPLITMMRGPLPDIGPVNYSYQADWYSGLVYKITDGRHPQTSQRYNYTTAYGFSAYIGAFYRYSSYRQRYYFEIYADKTGRNDPNTQVPVFNVDCTENITVEFPTVDNFHKDAYWLCRDIDGEALSYGVGDTDYASETFKGLENGKYSVYRYEYHDGEDGNGGWSGGRSYTFSLNNIHRGNGNIVSTNATCTSPGSKTVYYPECGHYNTEYSPALGHDYSVQYTYKTDGYHYKYCPRDGVLLDKQPNVYYVSYNGNGATSGSTASTTHTYGAAMSTTPNGYSRKNYKFNGWNTKADGTGINYNNTQAVSNLSGTNGATVTLYAQWIRLKNTVTFQDYDGKLIESKIVNAGDAVIPPTEPFRLGYSFNGWDKSLEEVTTDFTATAQYSVNSYTVIYASEVNQPSDISTQLFASLQTYDSALGILPNPLEKGYTFIGWFDGDKKISPETVFSPMGNPQNYVYNARWKVNNYHIRFLGNHYKLDQVIAEQDRDYYNIIGDLPELQIPGYTFMGWFDKNEKAITSESWVEPEDVDYTAHWEANQYNLHFDSNLYAIKKDPEDKTVTYDTAVGELPVLKTDGYTFLGWFTDPEKGEEITESTPVSIGNQTYYAHWTKNTYFMKFITDMATNLIAEISVVYDQVVGKLHVPKLEDFSFRGWYLSPYTATSSEAIYLDSATPSEALRIDEDTVYKIATSSEAYAYFDLVFREEDGNKNRRCGKDGILGNEDDNFYFNGEDKTAGTSDDRKIFKGLDGEYGTSDDYYEYEGYHVYSGKDGIFGTADDFVDLKNGTNLRAQHSVWWDNGALLVNNGYNMSPGTKYDWIWENEAANTIRRAGDDFIFFTEDDEIYWIGPDGIPGNEDDKLIHKGMDGQYGTIDDFIDNENGTNTRPGPDLIWGTEDDEIWWNGPDGIPGNEDDKLIHKGMDGQYGTIDDFIDNGDGTNTRPGPDLIWGTIDDEIWLNGPDGIPGNEDDILKVTKNNGVSVNVIQPVNVLPMYPSIEYGGDSDNNRGVFNKKITPQINTLKQSNYEGLGGEVLEDTPTLIPVENKETYIKDEISQSNIEVGSDKIKSFWGKLFNWLKEKKDEFAVLLFFLVLLAVLYEGSRRKNKGKIPAGVKKPNNKKNKKV